MNSKIVFDSSALIMLFAKEKGYDNIRQYLKGAVISSVNIAEVYKYCIETQQLSKKDCQELVKLAGIKIIDFDDTQAMISAEIINETKKYGFSLGDRACIALAMSKSYPALTCDKIWQKICESMYQKV